MIEYVILYRHLVFSATVTEIALTTRCTTKIVHIIWTTISHYDVSCPVTAVTIPVKTHRPADPTVCYCWVSTIQPAGCISATSVFRWTWRWHHFAGGPFETKPTRSDSLVTMAVLTVRNLSVSFIKNSVIVTFWYRKNRIVIINIRINLTFKKLENYLMF